MPRIRRVLPLLGGVLGAVLAAIFMPMAVGHAAGENAPEPVESCDGVVCLVQDLNMDDWHYSGFRPFITDWSGTQPYDVVSDGNTLGSYSISAEDTWTPFYSVWHYEYGDFTPASGVTDPDLGGFADLTGASVYDASIFGTEFLTLKDVTVHGHELSYYVTTLGDFTNVSVVDTVDGTSGDYFTTGDSDPQWLYNSLFHGEQFPTVPDYLVPPDHFASMDFDPGEFLGDSWAGM